MKISEESFPSYLRAEVEAASQRFELAKEEVLRLTEAPVQLDPSLANAVETLRQNFGDYLKALRRQANFTAH